MGEPFLEDYSQLPRIFAIFVRFSFGIFCLVLPGSS